MTMLDESILNQITISVNYPPVKRKSLIQAEVSLEDDNDRMAITRFLGIRNFKELNFIAAGIANRRTVGMDMQEMEYSQTPEGVKIGDGMEFTAHLSEQTFNRLMLTIYDKMIEAVNASSDELSTQDNWQEFLSHVTTLRERTQ